MDIIAIDNNNIVKLLPEDIGRILINVGDCKYEIHQTDKYLVIQKTPYSGLNKDAIVVEYSLENINKIQVS